MFRNNRNISAPENMSHVTINVTTLQLCQSADIQIKASLHNTPHANELLERFLSSSRYEMKF